MKYRQGDVFLAKLNPSKGNEPGKNRPVIIVQNDGINESDYLTCIIVPCSSVEMPMSIIRPQISEDFFLKRTYVLLDQVRAVDVSKRFLRKIGRLSDDNLNLVINSLISLISK